MVKDLLLTNLTLNRMDWGFMMLGHIVRKQTYGGVVWADSLWEQKRETLCLCESCRRRRPEGTHRVCPIAQDGYDSIIKPYNVSYVVTGCPKFDAVPDDELRFNMDLIKYVGRVVSGIPSIWVNRETYGGSLLACLCERCIKKTCYTASNCQINQLLTGWKSVYHAHFFVTACPEFEPKRVGG